MRFKGCAKIYLRQLSPSLQKYLNASFPSESLLPLDSPPIPTLPNRPLLCHNQICSRSPTPTCPVSLIYLKPLGATHVVDHNLPPLEIKKIANQSIPFDAIADRPTQQAGLNILAPGGTLVTVLAEKVKAQNKTMIHVAALLTAPPHLKLLETLSGKKLSGWLEEVVIKVSEPRDVWEAVKFMTFTTFTVIAQPS